MAQLRRCQPERRTVLPFLSKLLVTPTAGLHCPRTYDEFRSCFLVDHERGDLGFGCGPAASRLSLAWLAEVAGLDPLSTCEGLADRSAAGLATWPEAP